MQISVQRWIPTARRAAVLYRVSAAVALVLLALTAAAWADKDDLTLVSRATGAAALKANAGASESAVSPDGRHVAFASAATNLHPDDADATTDAFLRDVHTSATTLVSRATGAAGAKGNGASVPAAVSADGRYVAFESRASNLHPDDADTTSDVFVRDTQTATTILVSRATGGAGAKGNLGSAEPAISADGRYVVFSSSASNLHPVDGDATSDVFVRDLQTEATTLVSRAGGAAGAKGGGHSVHATISADGRAVAFSSDSSNLHPDDGDASRDIFVRNVQTNTTTLVSRAGGAAGAKGNSASEEGGISGDGDYVVFRSIASNLHPDDADTNTDVFVRDLPAATTTLVSRATGAAGAKANSGSLNRRGIAVDGRYVVFESVASNLHPSDSDATSDVYVRDLQTQVTALVSRATGAGGAKANGPAYEPTISADGRFVALTSTATNLHPDDGDTSEDIFVRDVLGVPAAPSTLTPPPPTPTPPTSTPAPPTTAPAALPAPAAIPAPATAAVAVGCFANRLILTDVFPRGGRARLLGVAPSSAAGKAVTIVSEWNGETIARPTVRRDLTFSAAVPLPPRRLRSTGKARYSARLGSKRSLRLRFARRMYTTALTAAGRTITLSGTVTKPLAKPIQAVVIRASESCSTIGRGAIVATVKPARSGAFRARFDIPAGQSTVFLRAQTKVRRAARSRKLSSMFTLIRGVRLGG